MDNDMNESLDEIVSYVSAPAQRKSYSERRFPKPSTTSSDSWAKELKRSLSGYGKNLRFAGCLLLVLGMLFVSVASCIIVPSISIADTTPPPPSKPPVPPNYQPPPTPKWHFSLPFEKPVVFSENDNDNTIIQPQLSLTQNVQPMISSIVIPNVFVVLIGLAVVEKLKVKKRMTRLRVVSGG